MGKPNASVSTVSKLELNDYYSQQQKEQYLFKEPYFKVLTLPVVKYYHGADLALIKSTKHIESVGLIEFLKELGIILEAATHYFHEVFVYNKKTDEKLKTLGFPNEEDGFELVNPFMKGTIGTQSISFIRGKKANPESIHIFKDSLDFLSFLSKIGGKKIMADVIILHANSCLDQIRPYIQNYGYKHLYSWMNNDKAGQKLQSCIQSLTETEEGLKHSPMNNLYQSFQNVHTWYQQRGHNGQ